MSSDEPTGVLVIRIWLEPGRADRLRARVVASRDIAHSGEPDAVWSATSVDQLCQLIRGWVDAFVLGSDDGRDTGGNGGAAVND